MNAGCYGTYVSDRLVEVRALSRDGRAVTIPAADLNLGYRHSDLPDGWVLTQATFEAPPGDPDALEARMADQLARRDATQPTKERSAGSTFRNPAGHSSSGADGEDHSMKAWAVIDRAGLRGARLGGAEMSSKHPNFLVNRGGATATEIEALGEHVRERVFADSGIRLEWEIRRIGDPLD